VTVKNTFLKLYRADTSRAQLALLCLLLVLLPFELYPRAELFNISIRLSQVVGLLLIFFSIPMIIKNRRDWFSNPWLQLGLFVLVSAASAMFAISRAKGLLVTGFVAFDFVLAYTVAQTFLLRDSELFKKLILALGLVVAAFCLYQFVGDTLGLGSGYTLLDIRYTKLVFGFPRVQGFSLEPLYLASYLLIPFCLALVSYIFSEKKYQAVLAFVFLSVIWLTVARGAFLAVLTILFGLAVLMVWQRRWRALIVTVFICGASLSVVFGMIWASGNFAKQLPADFVAPGSIQTNIPKTGINAQGNTERLLDHTTDFSSESSVTDRVLSAKAAILTAQSNPLIGVGPGNFGRYVVKTYPDKFVDTNQIANNEPLEILAEEGIIGLSLILIFVSILIWRGLHFRIKPNTKEANIWFFATAAMLVGFVVQWQTFSTLYVTHIWVIIGIYLAVLKQSILAKDLGPVNIFKHKKGK